MFPLLDGTWIRQRCPAFGGRASQKRPVLVQSDVVTRFRFPTFLTVRFLPANVTFLQTGAPEFHNQVLGAGVGREAICLTRETDLGLAGRALLGARSYASATSPNLARGARLWSSFLRRGWFRGPCWGIRRRHAGAILAGHLSRRTWRAGFIFAEFAGRERRQRLRRRLFTRSILADSALQVGRI